MYATPLIIKILSVFVLKSKSCNGQGNAWYMFNANLYPCQDTVWTNPAFSITWLSPIKYIEIELPTKERLDWNQSRVSTYADANWVI